MNEEIKELKEEIEKANKPKEKKISLFTRIMNDSLPDSLAYFIAFQSFRTKK